MLRIVQDHMIDSAAVSAYFSGLALNSLSNVLVERYRYVTSVGQHIVRVCFERARHKS